MGGRRSAQTASEVQQARRIRDMEAKMSPEYSRLYNSAYKELQKHHTPSDTEAENLRIACVTALSITQSCVEIEDGKYRDLETDVFELPPRKRKNWKAKYYDMQNVGHPLRWDGDRIVCRLDGKWIPVATTSSLEHAGMQPTDPLDKAVRSAWREGVCVDSIVETIQDIQHTFR